jgi:hypothetical protein
LLQKPSASVFSSSSSKARKRIGASQRKPLGEAAPSSKYPQFEFDPDDPWKGLGDGSGGGEGPAAKKKKTSYGGGPFSCSPIASIHHRHRSSAEVPSADMEALKLELSSARQLEQELRIRLGTVFIINYN